MTTFQISCPKCHADNHLDMYHLVEGARILCRRCDNYITLTFTGKTPPQLIENFRKELEKSLPEELKVHLR